MIDQEIRSKGVGGVPQISRIARTIIAKRNLSGKRFNRLTIIRQILPGKRSLCECDCGTIKELDTYNVSHGIVRSCGCLQREKYASGGGNLQHGDARPGRISPEFRSWAMMLDRCLNQSGKSYVRYGARGIRICDRWRESFANFLADMGRRPSPKHSIGRKDNDGNYEPDNCHWETPVEQARNRSSSRKITVGDVTATIAEWQERSGIRYGTIQHRLNRGWSPEAAVSEALRA